MSSLCHFAINFTISETWSKREGRVILRRGTSPERKHEGGHHVSTQGMGGQRAGNLVKQAKDQPQPGPKLSLVGSRVPTGPVLCACWGGGENAPVLCISFFLHRNPSKILQFGTVLHLTACLLKPFLCLVTLSSTGCLLHSEDP